MIPLVAPSRADESRAVRSVRDPAPRWQRTLIAAPDTLLIPFLWLCITVSVTIMVRAFSPWLVVPVTVVASALTWRWCPPSYRARFAWQSSAATLLGVLVWVVVNARFASQWLAVTRDPGFLTLEGIWLSKHTSPNPPAQAMIDIEAQVPGTLVGDAAYHVRDGVLHVQGAKLVPGLAAVSGWVGGIHGVLIGNILVGAVALLLFYGLARQMTGPLWGLAATTALAISMPFIGFTRAVYTEPAVVALTFGGITMLWAAYRTGSRFRFVLGGALVGAGGLARIDGAAVTIGLLIGLALVAAGTTTLRRRRELRGAYLRAGIAAGAVSALGLLELAIDSPEYLYDLRHEAIELVAATLVAAAIGVLVLAGPPWRRIAGYLATRARLFGGAAAGLVVLIGATLASRPLWFQAAGMTAGSSQSFDAQSVTWIAMYYSWVVVAAAVLGLAFALRSALIRREPNLLAALTIISAPSLLYLVNISITPDQLWAMRRFLPVTIPGFLLLAAWLFRALVSWLVAKRSPARVAATVAACAIAAAGFGFPIVTWTSSTLFTSVESGGQLGQVQAMCSLSAGRPVVIIGGPPVTLTPAVESICGVPAVGYNTRLTSAQLRSIAAAYGRRQPVLFVADSAEVPWAGGTAPAPYTRATITHWPQVFNTRPKTPTIQRSSWLAGTIDASGDVAGIEAPDATGH